MFKLIVMPCFDLCRSNSFHCNYPFKMIFVPTHPTVIQDFSFLLKLVCRLEENEVFYLNLSRLSPLPSILKPSIATFIIVDNDRMLRECCNIYNPNWYEYIRSM